MSMKSSVKLMALQASSAAKKIASMSNDEKNRVLLEMANSLRESTQDVLKANERDMELAEESGLSKPMLKRLSLTNDKIQSMAQGIISVSKLEDPVGRTLDIFQRPNGLIVKKISVPFGVVGVIYESRPNVTGDAAAICVKSGNAVILRGGKESTLSNKAITLALRKGLAKADAPQDCVQYLEDYDRSGFNEMIHLRDYIDLIVPRGGAGLIRAVIENATVPCIETGTGNCHIYVHENADLDTAISIIVNAKCSNPSVCNAAETVLIDKPIAPLLLPRLTKALKEQGVEIRGCVHSQEMVSEMIPASDTDWDEEYLDLVLAVKVVDGLDEAVQHIADHGTKHSEAILTTDLKIADSFAKSVDAACIYINASTRFTDGEEFGFGAEIGISTQKLHARGPMGLKELTTYKYVVSGNGQIR
jgi:glutamate-5-semialdehyde dehydrogenase